MSTTTGVTPTRRIADYRLAIDSLERQTGWPTELAKAYRRYGKFLRRRGQPEEAMRMLELASDTACLRGGCA